MNIAQKKFKLKMKKNKTLDRGDRTLQSARYRKKYPEKVTAHRAIYHALKTGNLKRPKICEMCGNNKLIQAHHPDYNFPLEIIWLCWCCHVEIHKVRR